MNALRQIVMPKNGKLSVQLPKEYTQKSFEVIVLPIDEPTNIEQIKAKMNAFLETLPDEEPTLIDLQKLEMAHKIIDMGTSVSHDFIIDFEKNKQDRQLTYREL